MALWDLVDKLALWLRSWTDKCKKGVASSSDVSLRSGDVHRFPASTWGPGGANISAGSKATIEQLQLICSEAYENCIQLMNNGRQGKPIVFKDAGGGEANYVVSVRTGKHAFAATSARCYITLYGSDGQPSIETELVDAGRRLVVDKETTFRISLNHHLGPLTSISL